MLKTNEDKIIEFSLMCRPGMPRIRKGWRVDHEGTPFVLPGIGGITLNVVVGDPAFGWAGDHVEPGVSATANAEKYNEFPNDALQLYACVGNEAQVVSGEAKGEKGVVVGHHGGSEHVIIDFDKSVMARMTYEDKIMIRAMGQGLQLLDYPGIKLFNMDPALLHRLDIQSSDNGCLKVPVTATAPAQCMGSGIGDVWVASGDYDIMTSDPDTVRQYRLDRLRFGDFVALLDHDNSYGRAYKKGAVSIGVVVHSDCMLAGHGPGIATVMTCAKPLIEPVIDAGANLADLLEIGTAR